MQICRFLLGLTYYIKATLFYQATDFYKVMDVKEIDKQS